MLIVEKDDNKGKENFEITGKETQSLIIQEKESRASFIDDGLLLCYKEDVDVVPFRKKGENIKRAYRRYRLEIQKEDINKGKTVFNGIA